MTTGAILPIIVSLMEDSGQLRLGNRQAGSETAGLASLSASLFSALLLEAHLRQQEAAANQRPPGTEPSTEAPSSDVPTGPEGETEPRPPAGASRLSAAVQGEADIILREAQRAGIDPMLLAALRRVENGGPGREFGVLAVPAAGVEEQARVAANTIRKNAVRFAAQGGEAVDPATGRYTEAFLRFFSSRYAPVGAGNDPRGLNRFHAANLIAAYRRVNGQSSG
jgi:hypothetical protein